MERKIRLAAELTSFFLELNRLGKKVDIRAERELKRKLYNETLKKLDKYNSTTFPSPGDGEGLRERSNRDETESIKFN